MVQLRYGNKGTWDDGKAWGQSLALNSLVRNSDDMTVMFDIAFSAGDDKGTVTVNNTAGASVTFSKLMDRLSFSSGISFFLASHTANEKYEVRSIEISAPCPARTKVSAADLGTKGKLFKDDLDINDLSDDGSSLTLSSSRNHAPLWSMPVQDASCFSDNGDYKISGKVDYSRVTGDNDMQFGIHDGSSVIGICRLDNDGGLVQLYYGNKGTLLG